MIDRITDVSFSYISVRLLDTLTMLWYTTSAAKIETHTLLDLVKTPDLLKYIAEFETYPRSLLKD